MARWIKMPLATEVGLGPGHTVLDGDPAPTSQKRGTPPIFGPCLLWPNSWMDQDATWYRGRPRSRRHCVRWWTKLPPGKGTAPTPLFGLCLLWPNCWRNQDANWYEGAARPRPHCVRWGPSSLPPKKKGAQPPNFRPMSVVSEQSPISVTADHLLCVYVCSLCITLYCML